MVMAQMNTKQSSRTRERHQMCEQKKTHNRSEMKSDEQ